MARMSSLQREKTIISLQLVDVIDSINTAMRVRKAMIGIDYSNGIEPKLTIKMPSPKREVWATLNTRRRLCVTQPLQDRDLLALETDIVERLQKSDGALILVAAKVPNQKMQARLQVRFKGMTQIALTLMHCDRHSVKEQTHFLICWTKGGRGQGGTGQAIRLAQAFGIPVYDLATWNEPVLLRRLLP